MRNILLSKIKNAQFVLGGVIFVQLHKAFLEHFFQLYFEIIPNSLAHDDETIYGGVNVPFFLISLKRWTGTTNLFLSL